MNIVLQISAKTYWGYRYYYLIEEFKNTTNENIIKEVKEAMKLFFESNNLLLLKEGIDNLNLHLHRPENIKEGDIIYICDHEH
jgi:hypothetical protein